MGKTENGSYHQKRRKKIRNLIEYDRKSHEAERMVQATDKIIDYARREGIETIIIAGSSGAYARDLFRMRWTHRYPKQKMPHFYSLGKTINKTFCEGGSAKGLWYNLDLEKKSAEFNEKMRKFKEILKENFGEGFFSEVLKKTMLLDEYDIGSLNSIGALKEILKNATGAKYIKKALLVAGANEPPKIDIIGMIGWAPAIYKKRNFLETAKNDRNFRKSQEFKTKRLLHKGIMGRLKSKARSVPIHA